MNEKLPDGSPRWETFFQDSVTVESVAVTRKYWLSCDDWLCSVRPPQITNPTWNEHHKNVYMQNIHKSKWKTCCQAVLSWFLWISGQNPSGRSINQVNWTKETQKTITCRLEKTHKENWNGRSSWPKMNKTSFCFNFCPPPTLWPKPRKTCEKYSIFKRGEKSGQRTKRKDTMGIILQALSKQSLTHGLSIVVKLLKPS